MSGGRDLHRKAGAAGETAGTAGRMRRTKRSHPGYRGENGDDRPAGAASARRRRAGNGAADLLYPVAGGDGEADRGRGFGRPVPAAYRPGICGALFRQRKQRQKLFPRRLRPEHPAICHAAEDAARSGAADGYRAAGH